MTHSRRQFLKTAAATALVTVPPAVAATPATAAAESPADAVTPQEIIALFAQLPGDLGLKILAPARNGGSDFVAEFNPDRKLFFASAIKAFALGEALRQVDSPDVVARLEQREVALDSSIWSFGSPIFNPPNVTGVVSERTTLEAMITRSDNTATDMTFKLAGVSNIRALIASAGLNQTFIPDSTRAFTAYLWGAQNYRDISWEELLELVENPIVHPFLNDVQTLASSAGDFVSYYSRALQGGFFAHDETLNEFRRLLTLCDFIYLVPLPAGTSAYAKSGNADFPGFHARSIAGGMYFSGQWVYFGFVLNWYADSIEDPETVAGFFSAIHQSLTRLRDSLSSHARGVPPRLKPERASP